MTSGYTSLPADLPVPVDDGAAKHLKAMRVPSLALPSTMGADIDLSRLSGRAAVFAYPMTGKPGVALPDGWDAIPGARGCTPQNCAIRDMHGEFASHGVSVFALSTQPTAYQQEMAARLHLPYPVLSDADFQLTDGLRLPTFMSEGTRLLRRITLIISGGVIEQVFYPVFPPDRSAAQVLDWLRDV